MLACTLLWGGTFLAIKLVFHRTETPPMFLVATRFTLSTLIFLVFFWRPIWRTTPLALVQGLMLGACLLGGFGLQTLGLQHTSIARSAFITQLIVVFTPALQLLLYRRVPRSGTLAGIIVVLVGMYFLTSPDGNAKLNQGDWLTLGCAVCFSLYIVYIDRFGTAENAATLSFDQTLFVAAFAWLATVQFEFAEWPRQLHEIRVDFLLGLLYLAPLGTNLALYIQTRWQPESTPARAAVIFAMEPVFATLFAVMFADEAFVARSALGAALIFAGLLISELRPASAAQRS